MQVTHRLDVDGESKKETPASIDAKKRKSALTILCKKQKILYFHVVSCEIASNVIFYKT